MKTRLSPKLIVTAVLAAAATSANAQSLGSAAAYDIFVMNNGALDLKDANQLYGQVAFSNGSTASGQDIQNFDGAVHMHSGSSFTFGPGFNPSGGLNMSPAVNSSIDQANADVLSYSSYLGGLTADINYTAKVQTGVTLNTSKAMTVVDFTEIDVAGSNFNFIGRAGQSDQLIIRISNQLAFDGVDINLTNLDSKDVIWYLSSTNAFDLHKGFTNFSGTVLAPDGNIIIGEVDRFKGAVYGSDLTLGSGFVLEGNSVPEPSASLMLISGVGVLLLVRRRKN